MTEKCLYCDAPADWRTLADSKRKLQSGMRCNVHTCSWNVLDPRFEPITLIAQDRRAAARGAQQPEPEPKKTRARVEAKSAPAPAPAPVAAAPVAAAPAEEPKHRAGSKKKRKDQPAIDAGVDEVFR